MPKYEVIVLTRVLPRVFVESHKRVLKHMATHILDNGGVVRRFENLGKEQTLPYRMNKHQDIYDKASIYSMTFDCGPKVLPSLKQLLSYDEDVLRSTVIKLGDSIGKMSNYTSIDKM